MRGIPLGPSVDFPMGPHTPREACAKRGMDETCGPFHWDRRWSALCASARVRKFRNLYKDLHAKPHGKLEIQSATAKGRL